MGDGIAPDLTRNRLYGQRREFVNAAFENGDRRTQSGFGCTQKAPETGAADQSFIETDVNVFSNELHGEDGDRGFPRADELNDFHSKTFDETIQQGDR